MRILTPTSYMMTTMLKAGGCHNNANRDFFMRNIVLVASRYTRITDQHIMTLGKDF